MSDLVSDVNEVLIHRTCGQNGGEPEDILFTACDSRLNIVLEKDAELTLIERHASHREQEKEIHIGILLHEGAKLYHYRFQEDDLTSKHSTFLSVSLKKGAVYDVFTLTSGAKESKYDIKAVLEERDAACFLKEVKLLSDAQKADIKLFLNHNEGDNRSSIECRSVLDDMAVGGFDAVTYVEKGANGTKASQLSRAVLLSDGAEMKAKPELQIFTDDVECAHGATTGQLDPEQLFYLRARGISETQAREMLIEAFLREIVEKVRDDSLKEEIIQKIGEKLRS